MMNAEEMGRISQYYFNWYQKYPELTKEAFHEYCAITGYFDCEFASNLGQAFLLEKAGEEHLPSGFLNDLRKDLRYVANVDPSSDEWWNNIIIKFDRLMTKYANDRRAYVICHDILGWAQDECLRIQGRSF